MTRPKPTQKWSMLSSNTCRPDADHDSRTTSSASSTLHWLQSAQVSWLGLCGPITSPWSAGTSLLASIECHADDRQTLFHPFSLVGCQGRVNNLPSFLMKTNRQILVAGPFGGRAWSKPIRSVCHMCRALSIMHQVEILSAGQRKWMSSPTAPLLQLHRSSSLIGSEQPLHVLF